MQRLANYILLFLASAFPVMTAVSVDLDHRTRSYYTNPESPTMIHAFLNALGTPVIFTIAFTVVLVVLGKEFFIQRTINKIKTNGTLFLIFGLIYVYTEYSIFSARVAL